MRLNFSGVGEDDIREGIRRIGEVVREQVELYGTLTGRSPAERRAAASRASRTARADVLPSCRGRARAGGRRSRGASGRMSRVAVLKGGRSLERQVSLRSGARVEDALERLGHEVVAIDVGADLVARLTRARARRWRSSRCTAATARTAPSRSCSRRSASPTPARACRPASARPTRCWPSTRMRDAGIPTPGLLRVQRDRVQGARRRRRRCRAIEERLEFPLVVKPAGQGSALGVKFARTPADVPGALVAAFSYDRKVLLERYVPGRDLAVSVLDEDGTPRALPVVEAVPARGGLLRLRVALRDREHHVRLPGRARRRRGRARAGARARGATSCSAAAASRAST